MDNSRQISLIINPTAGGLPSRSKLNAMVKALCEQHQIDIKTFETKAPGDATVIARRIESANDCDSIIVCGGDGTMNEVINGIQNTRIKLGLIQGGTANVWAKEAGIPSDPLKALRLQLDAPAIPVDVGRIGDRKFLLMAGFGLDAATVAAVRPRVKRYFGGLAYLLAGVEMGSRYRGMHVSLQLDNDPPIKIQSNLIVIGNTRLYGGFTQITSKASAVDGFLDCVVFHGNGPLSTLRTIPDLLLNRSLRSNRMTYRRARHIRICPIAGHSMPTTQIDGDIKSGNNSEIYIEPAARRMIVPNIDKPVFQP